jgi:hypothetical protein
MFAGCTSPNKREAVELTRPNGEKVVCFIPPADVMTSERDIQVKAAIPKIKDVLNTSTSINEKYQRIREEIPNLQTIEVLEFRACVAYANGLFTPSNYMDLVNNILPLIKDKSPSKPSGTNNTSTKNPPEKISLAEEEDKYRRLVEQRKQEEQKLLEIEKRKKAASSDLASMQSEGKSTSPKKSTPDTKILEINFSRVTRDLIKKEIL